MDATQPTWTTLWNSEPTTWDHTLPTPLGCAGNCSKEGATYDANGALILTGDDDIDCAAVKGSLLALPYFGYGQYVETVDADGNVEWIVWNNTGNALHWTGTFNLFSFHGEDKETSFENYLGQIEPKDEKQVVIQQQWAWNSGVAWGQPPKASEVVKCEKAVLHSAPKTFKVGGKTLQIPNLYV